MRTRRRATITDLREAVDGLPRDTRVAMLEGIADNDIIVGAYTGPDGICPMLAAHRAGAKTSFIAFAQAWDMFALGGARDRAARRATRRELLVLSAHLEASLLDEDAVPGLAETIAEHRGLRGRRTGRQTPADGPGDYDLGGELRSGEGWPWTLIVRRHDDYERALARLERESAGVSERDRDRVPATADRG